MVLIFLSLLAAQAPADAVRTELQVEAVQPPDRAAELAAELARAQAELVEAKAVAEALPDGEEKDRETKRLESLSQQIADMRGLVEGLRKPSAPPNRPAPATSPPAPGAAAPAPPAPPRSVLWIAIGLGLIVGAFIALALTFRALPGGVAPGTLRVPQLAILAALLAAIGPQLMRLGYDQPLIVFGWGALSVGAVLRMGLRRVRSQIERFALERAAEVAREDEDE